jgi:fatty-acyl-CoA synthase
MGTSWPNRGATRVTGEVGAGAVTVALLPSFHAAGCVISHLGPVVLGGAMVLVEDFDPTAVLRAVADEGASVLMSEPTVLESLVRAARASGDPVPRLDTVLVGVSTVPGTVVEAVEQAFGASAHNFYGRAELSPVLCMTRRSDDPVTGVGRPLPHTEVKIVDPVSGDVQPLGVPGEIYARGDDQMLGYFDDPVATAATVDSSGWLHTGDLGSTDERGMITLSSRWPST